MPVDVTPYHQQLAKVIRSGKKEVWMDHATDYGRLAVDPTRSPNAKQNSLGHILPNLAIKGYLVRTDRRVESMSPTRKRGMQGVWLVTAKGRKWADELGRDDTNGGQTKRTKRTIPRTPRDPDALR